MTKLAGAVAVGLSTATRDEGDDTDAVASALERIADRHFVAESLGLEVTMVSTADLKMAIRLIATLLRREAARTTDGAK